MKPITYSSDQAAGYSNGLTACKTLAQLRNHLDDYHAIAADAMAAIPVDEEQFALFRAGLLMERKGSFAGETWADRFSVILMPEVMFQVGMIAAQYFVPWGMAFLRLKDAGRIVFDDSGVSHWIQPKQKKAAA